MTAEPLKPCPFCDNSKPEVYHECNSNKELYRVKCRKCGIQTHLESKDRVIAIWNRRVEPIGNSEELPEWLVRKLNEKLMPGSRPWNYETKVIMNTLEWVLSLRRDKK